MNTIQLRKPSIWNSKYSNVGQGKRSSDKLHRTSWNIAFQIVSTVTSSTRVVVLSPRWLLMSPPHWGSGWPSAWILSKKSLLGSPGPPRGGRACDSKEAQGSPNTAQAYEDIITPFNCLGSTADVQLLPAQLQKHVLGHPAPLLNTCLPHLPQLAEKQDGPWLHKSHRSYGTPQKRCLTTHLRAEIRNCSEVISGQNSSLGTEMTEHLGPPLLTPLFVTELLTCAMSWPGPTIGPNPGKSPSREESCSSAGALWLHGKFLNDLGLAGCGGEHKSLLGSSLM